MNSTELQAGRELDARVLCAAGCKYLDGYWRWSDTEIYGSDQPSPSTNASVALFILDRVAGKRGWTVRTSIIREGLYDAVIHGNPPIRITTESIPVAICSAILAWKEQS